MSRNKTSKYIKYAVGEIILVVIGILIALQINNWNENNKATNNMRSDLYELKTELNYDLNRLDSVINIIDRVDDAGKFLLNYLTDQPKIVDSSLVQSCLIGVTILASFSKSNSAHHNLITNGNFQRIKNKKLKEKLGFYYNEEDWQNNYHDGPLLESYYEYIRMIHNYTKPGFIRKYYEAFWLNKSDSLLNELSNRPFTSNIDYDKLNGDKKFIALLDQVQLSRTIQKYAYTLIKNDIEDLTILIDSEIEN